MPRARTGNGSAQPIVHGVDELRGRRNTAAERTGSADAEVTAGVGIVHDQPQCARQVVAFAR